MSTGARDRPATFRTVLAIQEFRALYLAHTLSVAGDQLARIAIASVVFTRTNSAALTGLSYASSYLPWLLGGPSLSVLADRLPRRAVMIHCDLARCILVAAIAVGRVPIALLFALVGLVCMLQPPFAAARAALIPAVVGEGARYRAAANLTSATSQIAVAVGFSAGGLAISEVGATPTLILDALTFALSAALTYAAVHPRPSALTRPSSWRLDMAAGAMTVLRSPRLRYLALSSWVVVGVAISTEAAAIPYAHAHRGGAVAAGLLTAALPAGTVVGALVLSRISNDLGAERALPLLNLGAPLTLMLTGLNPALLFTGVAWFVAGAFSATTVLANRLFVVGVPDELRARAFGFAAAGISGAQGLGTLAVGTIATYISPSASVCAVGAGAVLLLALVTRLGVSALGNSFGAGHRVSRCRPQSVDPTTCTSPSRGLPAS